MSDTPNTPDRNANDGGSGGQTPAELVPEHRLAGIESNWTTGDEWDGHDYNEIPIPDEKRRPKFEWDVRERRAYLLTLLRDHGTWSNVPMTQSEVAEDFGIPQQSIHRDVKELRRYIRFHAGNRAISMTELVAQRAVSELQQDEDWFKALQAQLDYDEFLFELGRLDRAPEKKEIDKRSVDVSADAGDLNDEEREKFASIAQNLRSDRSGDDIDKEEIHVENVQSEDDD